MDRATSLMHVARSIKGQTMTTKLITHSGRFHADDVFAATILTTLFPQAQLVRTRNADEWENSDTAIVFDVGMVYDPQINRFDHHQATRPIRPDPINNLDIPYSSLGLIWKHYGPAYLKHMFEIEGDVLDTIWTRVDRRFVIKIDMGDNNVIPDGDKGLSHPMSITRLIESFAPDFDNRSQDTENQGFQSAMAVAKPILDNKIRSLISEYRAEQVARICVQNRTDPRVVELPQGMPYMSALKAEQADDVLYVVAPGNDDDYLIMAVRDTRGESGCKKPFPFDWAGLRGTDLEMATGVKGAEFCHMGRFLTTAASREAAFQLLNIALDA
jgi:uncharacterized UPF0160 family protein